VSKPWHLWVVGILTLLWNGAGAVTIVMAQVGSRLDMAPNEVAYYANQPIWFVLATDLALFVPIAGAVALLLRHHSAVWLFALSLLAIVVTDAYDIAAGTSLALVDQGWRNLTIVVMAIALLQFVYAWSMKGRGVLK
jgi:cell division protein FtsW (lipid II flippase)